MSSDDPFVFYASSDMVSSDGNRADLLFFSEPYFPPFFTVSPSIVAQENSCNQNPFDETQASLDPFSPVFSFSPPSPTNLYHYHPLSNVPEDDELEVKIEECPMDPQEPDNISKFMQRSFSSNSFHGKPGFLFQPCYDTTVMADSPNFHSQAAQASSSPENNFFSDQIRRVYSAGDLQNVEGNSHSSQNEGSFLEEANFKVGRYSAEERKRRISKYRAKRSQRNFNKTIKYACRKTLADRRPRIRGRFARNDDTNEIPKGPCSSSRDEDEDELWLQGLHEAAQFQYLNLTLEQEETRSSLQLQVAKACQKGLSPTA